MKPLLSLLRFGAPVAAGIAVAAPPAEAATAPAVSTLDASLGLLAGFALLAAAAAFFAWRRAEARFAAAEAARARLADRDPLLDLPNRLVFLARLDEALAGAGEPDGRCALMILDIDRFTEVNDALGHEAGDRLLVAAADRLAARLRPREALARLGGDEFAVLAVVGDRRQAAARARELLAAFADSFDLGERPALVTASLGAALAPDDATARADLMQRAESALHRAKSDGRNRYRLFEPQIGAEMAMRRRIAGELRGAVERGEITLHFQPIFDVESEAIVSFEALLRWPGAAGESLPPDLVVAVAEERGLIPLLGERILRQACLAARDWGDAHIAVNVSPIQFRQSDFVARVMAVLAETGFDPNRLELELTEGVLVADADMAERAMIALREAGVRMALDDFGSGYASLMYLRRFPFDKIKIDRSFLEAVEESGETFVLLESAVRLGKDLGLTVTAEGVESEMQLRLLRRLGCHQMQGFLFAKAMPESEVPAFLAANAQKRAAAARAVA